MTHEETVPNKALSGAELKAIMIEKFVQLVHNDSMLGDGMAYGRISYDITLRMHMDNPAFSEVIDVTASSPIGRNIVASAPELGALESGPPLHGPTTDKATASGLRLTHDITSPNAERLAHGFGVPVDTRRTDGTVRTEQIKFPRGKSLDNVRLENLTEQTKRELGVK